MPRWLGSRTAALAAFIALTLASTCPIALRPGSVVRDPGDPLLNAWILARNVQSIRTGTVAGFFDANIFFPAPNTLAYSEFLIPQTILAAPVLLATGNPILAYNLVLLAAIATSGFGMYLLASHLNGRAAGFIAGILFAFGPFMLGHLSHLQVLSAGGLPLAFLFLHRYCAGDRTDDLLAFSACFVIQALANAYYALYLTLFAGLALLLHLVRRHRYLDARFWGHMALHASIVLVTVGPVFSRYLILRRDLGFVRQPIFPATALSFLATPSTNWLYGEATRAFSLPEGTLFPGATALALAATGLVAGLALRGPVRHTGPSIVPRLYRALGWGVAAGCALMVAISVTGGLQATVLSIRVSAASYRNPLVLTAVLLAARVAVKRRYRISAVARVDATGPRLMYGWMLVLAILLTIPGGPSAMLREHVPGFDALRAVSRMHVMSLLALAVLASYGVVAWRRGLGGKRGTWLAGALALLMVVEYASVPIPVVAAPVGRAIPPVYRWLASQPEDFAIAEYPIRAWSAFWQVYFSAYHHKRLVTGFSGYAPPTYVALRTRNEEVPSRATVVDLEAIGVRYLIVHDRASSPDATTRLEAELSRLSDRVRPVRTFAGYGRGPGPLGPLVPAGRTLVYELTRSEWQSPRLVHSTGWSRAGSAIAPPDRARWVVTASPNPDLAPLAIDGDPSTRWHSEAQAPGDRIQLDLGRPMTLDGVLLDVAAREGDYPRGYRVEVSMEGTRWSTVASNPDYRLPITELLRPEHRTADIRFPATEARHVRVVQTGRDRIYWWSVQELHVTTPTGTRPAP